jgi:hypothetical protein
MMCNVQSEIRGQTPLEGRNLWSNSFPTVLQGCFHLAGCVVGRAISGLGIDSTSRMTQSMCKSSFAHPPNVKLMYCTNPESMPVWIHQICTVPCLGDHSPGMLCVTRDLYPVCSHVTEIDELGHESERS